MKLGPYSFFRQHLDYFAVSIANKPASTASFDRQPFHEGRDRSYWTENSGTTPKWYNRRTIAYLAAYVDWAGPNFPTSGLRVSDGFVKPDRAVMRSLLNDDFVRHAGDTFRLTDKGRALLAPFVLPPSYEGAAT